MARFQTRKLGQGRVQRQQVFLGSRCAIEGFVKRNEDSFPSPPRLRELRRRAASTSSCRIARAAMRLKCIWEVATPGDFASFSHASLTKAVGLSVFSDLRA